MPSANFPNSLRVGVTSVIVFSSCIALYLLVFPAPVSATEPPPPTRYTLTLNRTGGDGIVEVDPPYVFVSDFPWTNEYAPGTEVEFLQYCVDDWAFLNWTGVTQHSGSTHVHMNADKTVTAVFEQASVSISDVDICGDAIGIELGGTGLSGQLVVTLIAAASSHDIYQHSVSAGTHTIPFGWGASLSASSTPGCAQGGCVTRRPIRTIRFISRTWVFTHIHNMLQPMKLNHHVKLTVIPTRVSPLGLLHATRLVIRFGGGL